MTFGRPGLRGRVLQVVQPSIGGVPAYVATLARGLAERGWDIVVAAPAESTRLQRLASAGVQHLPLDVERMPELRRDGVAVAQLARQARRHHVDLVHGHSSKASVLSVLVARFCGVPSLYTPHAWSFQMRYAVPVRVGLGAVEATLNRSHKRIIAVCDAEAAAAQRWGIAPAERIRVVHTGLPTCDGTYRREPARAALGIEDDQVVVAWVGRRGAQKRPEALARVASRLPRPGVVLALGYGLHEDRALTSALRKSGVRLLPDGVPAERLLAGADVFVSTSAWEGFPLTILEAMRAGLPVVAHAVGGVTEQVEDGVTGHLVQRDDAVALAQRVRELVHHGDERRRMGAAAAERFEQRFTVDRMLDGVERVYEEILSPARSGRRFRRLSVS